MKKVLLLLYGIIAIISCNSQITSYHYINQPRNINVGFTKVNDSVLSFDNVHDKAIIGYINTIFSQNLIMTIDSVKMDFQDNIYKYLIFKGTNDTGAIVLVAHQVDLTLETNFYKIAPDDSGTAESHSCTGVRCGCCSFLRKKDKSIYGCTCSIGYLCEWHTDSYCNHSVTTTN